MTTETKAAAANLLDPVKILALLKKAGPIGQKLKSFEERPEQLQILTKLISAFNEKAIALIEAGTGTGKSLGYLIPSILAATIWKEKVVISTHTISLQEQIINKDLPLLKSALGVDIKACLVKGMSNYICLRKLDESYVEKLMLSDADKEIFGKVEVLARESGKGCKSDLPFATPHAVSELIFAEQEACNGPECPYYSNCYYFEARKKAQDADLLVVNHHLLLSDLAVRKETENFEDTAILPHYTRIILDEAHHFEEIATHFFAEKVSKLDLLKTLSRLTSEKQGKQSGKLPQLRSLLFKEKAHDQMSPLSLELAIDLPALRKDLLKAIADFFSALEMIAEHAKENEENSFRIHPHHFTEKMWKEGILPLGKQCVDLLNRYSRQLERLEGKIKEQEDDKLLEKCKSPLYEIKSLSKRLLEEAKTLNKLIEIPPTKNEIRWIESYPTKSGTNTSFIEASLEIAEVLQKNLFAPFKTVALFSATLSTGGTFSYIRERMGLTETLLEGRAVIESKSESPFDFKKQALFLIPKDLPDPNAQNFTEEAVETMWEAIQASRGNAFILFTSYGMLKACYTLLEERLRSKKYTPLRQGDENRSALLKKFIANEGSVLFATSSFWEGVDVVGEALRLVIIAKLPFSVPTEPLTEARSEAYKEKGESAFFSLLLPQAAIKLKQGFGRLIRNKKDRGCILCLDNRLILKPYGKYLLATLPPCPRKILLKSEIKAEMSAFYRKTDYLTKNQ